LVTAESCTGACSLRCFPKPREPATACKAAFRGSNVQGAPVSVEHRFLHHFRQRRVREDGMH
jgi:hypothetical protein